MEQVIGLFLLILVSGASIISLLLVINVFFEKLATSAATVIEHTPKRALVLGVVNLFSLLALFSVFAAVGEGTGVALFFLPALILLGVMLFGVIIGLLGFQAIIADRLFIEDGVLRRQAGAASLLYLACLVPIVGWFFFLPAILIVGFGGFVGAILERYIRPK